MRDAAVLALALRLLDQEARLRPDAAWHPSPEDLTAYHAGRLGPARTCRVRRHLGFCFDCPDLLLDLERFLEPGRPSNDADASWVELRLRLGRDDRGWRWRRILSALRILIYEHFTHFRNRS